MVAGLNGHAWFGLIVYFVTMGFVIRGWRIPLPLVISKPIISILCFLRLRDPPSLSKQPGGARLQRKQSPPLPPSSPLGNGTPQAGTGSGTESAGEGEGTLRPSLRSRSESKIGVVQGPSDQQVREGEEEDTLDEMDEQEQERLTVVVDLRTAPVAAVILLLMTKTIDGHDVRLGIVGEGGDRPYDVLVLFISLAYISTALDSTGGLRALSFYITQRAAKRPKNSPASGERIANGNILYSILYAFWFLAGVIVGNDPIILSGTAFLAYFTRFSGIPNPAAWTFSQFIAANVASAVLVTSNPTNVLLSGAFELNFLTGYTAWTILPSVITGLVAFPLTFYTYKIFSPPTSDPTVRGKSAHQYIPPQLLPPEVDPRSALIDPKGAYFHTGLMGVTLALIVGTSFVPGGKVHVWMVTAAGGIVAVLRDFWSERKPNPTPRLAATTTSVDEFELQPSQTPSTIVSGAGAAVAASTESSPPLSSPRGHSTRCSLPSFVAAFVRRFPTTSSTISRLPLSLLPFAGGVFVLSRALTSLGWTSIWAGWLAKISINPAATVFFLQYLITFVLCPIAGTNIGATTIMVQILREPAFLESSNVVADPRILKGAIFSTALASNIGAVSWTFSASLAGLLWVSILGQKGIKVRARDFAAWNLWFLPILSTTAAAVVLMQCYCFNFD
ncbi:hypothetical protein T439DRAFT_360610 [Meredithblackwellia eburnea MCA 4105]